MSEELRNKTPADAKKEVFDRYNVWSGGLSMHGVQAAYAIIAANWAVHGSADKILGNNLAKWSMAFTIVFLGLNLAFTSWQTSLHRKRVIYANDKRDEWEEEYETAKTTPDSPFPYTKKIETLGYILGKIRLWGPLIAGGLFILSLF